MTNRNENKSKAISTEKNIPNSGSVTQNLTPTALVKPKPG